MFLKSCRVLFLFFSLSLNASEKDKELFLDFCQKVTSIGKMERSYCEEEWDLLKDKKLLTEEDRLHAIGRVHGRLPEYDFNAYGYFLYRTSSIFPYFVKKHTEEVGEKMKTFLNNKN